jgi:excinuclease ABC subunit A
MVSINDKMIVMPENEYIHIYGARVHNLKNINVDIPRNKLIVITGLSGSGKSSLAFDTLYAEGQRRYIESLSSYARQFLEQMEKPDCEKIEGLSPAISIEQKTAGHNPRSTLATITEIHDYLRLLYARVGEPHCPECGKAIKSRTIDQIVDEVLKLDDDTKFYILSPVVMGRKGLHKDTLDGLKREGFVRVIIDGYEYTFDEEPKLDRNKIHDIFLVVDRLVMKSDIQSRVSEGVELALSHSENESIVIRIFKNDDDYEDVIFSRRYTCPDCHISLGSLKPRDFSFNSPYGRCEVCDGLGFIPQADPELIVPDTGLSINEGAVDLWKNTTSRWVLGLIKSLEENLGIDLDVPIEKLPDEKRKILFYGSDETIPVVPEGRKRKRYLRYKGLIEIVERNYHRTESEQMREFYFGRYITNVECPGCGGLRLKPESLAVYISGENISQLCQKSVDKSYKFFENLDLSGQKILIAEPIIKEIVGRLGFLQDVGLSYLTLDRMAPTLSGGEAHRIRLATQIGSGLVGVLYILDEPTIGLHARDNRKLLSTLTKLRDLGNTVIVVEHDPETILTADHIIDLGPGAGVNGGLVVAQGTPKDIMKVESSITGKYISGSKRIDIPDEREKGNGEKLVFRGCAHHNLKNIDVDIPLGTITCFTGVSGSGKSSLLSETIYRILARRINRSPLKPGKFEEIEGLENVNKVIEVDQSPIGRTPRSNPATYTNVFTNIRDLFSRIPEAKIRGYKPGRFSFNVKDGRCEACRGMGVKKVEMHLLPDLYIVCDVCDGKRFNRETLQVKYKGKNISNILNMTIDEAHTFFENIPAIESKLRLLKEVGLGYLELGQPATTLSGGEAQRIKLTKELKKRATGKTVYILDEPTTGLHYEDVRKLLNVLYRLRDDGNTILIIEHNLEVIKVADYIIDLGPEGGDEGGYIVAEGTPEEIARNNKSYTGEFLKNILKI